MVTTGARLLMLTDYLEKNWVTSYGGRGGTYPVRATRRSPIPKKDLSGIIAKGPMLLTVLMVSLQTAAKRNTFPRGSFLPLLSLVGI
jgi:hypothetical protein